MVALLKQIYRVVVMDKKEITIFDKVLKGDIEVEKVYEDNKILAFKDINPQAPVHILIIPKKKLSNVAEAESEDIPMLGEILYAAKKIAKEQKIDEKGYRLVFNNKEDAGQTVNYIHCHLLGGRPLGWPPG